jgi:hypothetical protein
LIAAEVEHNGFMRGLFAGVIMFLEMPFPIKICVVCSEEFELRPDKPGFANRCPSCSEPETTDSAVTSPVDPGDRKAASEMNAARRRVIRDMLYRKDS